MRGAGDAQVPCRCYSFVRLGDHAEPGIRDIRQEVIDPLLVVAVAIADDHDLEARKRLRQDRLHCVAQGRPRSVRGDDDAERRGRSVHG